MKVYIDTDDIFPVFTIWVRPEDGEEIEVDGRIIRRWRRVIKEWEKIQDEMNHALEMNKASRRKTNETK